MDDGLPKNYSTVYYEDEIKPPVPTSRSKLDGGHALRVHENAIDLKQVVAKLKELPQENYHRAYATDTLREHHTSVFNSRPPQATSFCVYVNYYLEKETYLVRINRNSLRAVKDKMPKPGNFRYFFKRLDNTNEEVEQDQSVVPYYKKDGQLHIYCQVFPAK